MSDTLNKVYMIDDPEKIIMIGYSDFTGQFDPITYAQAPVNEEDITPYKLPNIKSGLFSLYLTLDLGIRTQFYPLITAMNHAMTYNDAEAALQMLLGESIPEYLEGVRTEALYFFNIVKISKSSNTIQIVDSVTDSLV